MQLHELVSVSIEGQTFIAECDITDFEGERYVCDYVVQPGDTFGLAPQVAAAVVAWVAAGKTVTTVTAPNPVPFEVTRFQAKAALAQIGKLDLATSVVAASGDAVLQLAWAEAPSFPRHSVGINALAPALGLTQSDLDDLFRLAAGISA